MTIAATSTQQVTWGDLCNARFWRSLAPQLCIGGAQSVVTAVPRQSYERLAQRMSKDGYFCDSDEVIERLAPLVGEAVKRCVAVGLPAVFAWIYDEPWACYARLRPIFAHFLGAEFKPLPAFWAWHVDPQRGETGWKPHRDNRYNSLGADGSPLSLTCWVPLSDADPLNSCMYIVPKHMDAAYGAPPGRAGAVDALVCRACTAGEAWRLPGLGPMRLALGWPDQRVCRAPPHEHGTRVSARRRPPDHAAVRARGTSPGYATRAGAGAPSRL
ncbi:hypothetical protein [Variovorax soli]|uniref:hypothetical protein n=1 Tax=Variovorax soli TaxID=376815 RepID=UPI00286CF4EC|nr:hypothetical protein [Variovorax soli]